MTGSPTRTTPDIPALPSAFAEYERLNAELLRSLGGLKTSMLIPMTVSVDLERVVEASRAEQERFRQTLVSFTERTAALSPINWNESVAVDISKLMENLRPAKELAEFLSSTRQIAEQYSGASRELAAGLAGVFTESARLGEQFKEQFREMARSVDMAEECLRSRMHEIAEATALARSTIASLPWLDAGSLIAPDSATRQMLANVSREFSSSFQSLSEILPTMARQVPVPLGIAELSLFEHFNGACLLEQVSVRPSKIVSRERKSLTRQRLLEETEDVLPRLLGQLDTNLPRLWTGARQSRKSDNPDRGRHAMVSMRELFREVLHRLAPDNSVRDWTKDRSLFDDKNRPTRRARMLYICRNAMHEKFRNFVLRDVDALVAFEQLLEQGTHDTQSTLSAEFLASMELRMESTVRFLIEISRSPDA